MDRNNIIGFVLLLLLAVGYFSYNQYEQSKYFEQKRQDSVINARNRPRVAPVEAAQPLAAAPTSTDSATAAQQAAMPQGYNGTATNVMLENGKVAITFSTKGAFPTAVQLKEYKTYSQQPLYLFNGKNNVFNAILPHDNGKSTESLYYIPTTRTEADGSKTIDFASDLGNGKKVNIIYTLPATDYMVTCKVLLTGMPTQQLKLHWNLEAPHTEKDISNERQSTQVYYKFKEDDFDYFTARENEEKTYNTTKSVSWLGVRKQYFTTVLLSEDGFAKLDEKAYMNTKDSNVTVLNKAEFLVPLRAGAGVQTAALKWYFGPNDYNTLKSYNIGMDEMVPLGVGIMSFVKYINRFLIVPVFYLLVNNVKNMALVIVLLTLLVRLVLSFFTYKSYLSAAKMRVLKPELDEMRAKIGDDQQKMSMEQMKLYRNAGVNPLGGCLPMLFQLPILLSMYYMFPSFIEFRQKSFLWANDLSTYDSVLNFGFNIPFYGDHISLFTLIMTASSLFLAVYNRNMTQQDPNNPMLQYMPYIFPIILMGVFNKMAAALTFYYAFSNILSITQQFIIQKYFIDEKAIHAQLQENKTKPVATSKWQEKLAELQKQQAEKTQIQNKGKK